MALNRRQLLQYTGASCALAALPPSTGAAAQLRAYLVQDMVAAPRFEKGDLVVADVEVGKFTGPGLYLYPAWGQPRLYDVQATGDRLHFRNPGSGQLLWTQSANLDSAFAGRVLDRLESATALATLPDLAVPRLPFTA